MKKRQTAQPHSSARQANAAVVARDDERIDDSSEIVGSGEIQQRDRPGISIDLDLGDVRACAGRTSSDPGPWHIVRWGGGYRATPDADPIYLYTDDVIGILPKRNLNNGQPSLHAALIAAAAPQPGEHVLHIGAGVGYYTILAELVGATGRVTAIEYDAELAARATANLAQTPHVRVVHGDGTRIAFEPADVIYVNAGATRPADAWLDRLKEGGRLILPLTADAFPNRDVRRGAVFRIERHGPEFLARRISGVAIFPCEGGRDEAGERALGAAFDKGGAERVTRLYRRDDLPEDQCWLRAPGWCLAYR